LNNSQKKDLTGVDALDSMCEYMRLEARNLGHGHIHYPSKEQTKMDLTICNGLVTHIDLTIQNKTKSFNVQV